MSAVKVGWEVTNKAPSYFDMMEVLPTASTKEINKGYKAAAVRLHPDKRQSTGDDEDGDEAFVALKAAYDVLMDTNLRDVYSKFGLPGIEHKNDTTELMGTLGFFYVVWLAVAYLLTRRKAVAASQTWTFTGLLALNLRVPGVHHGSRLFARRAAPTGDVREDRPAASALPALLARRTDGRVDDLRGRRDVQRHRVAAAARQD